MAAWEASFPILVRLAIDVVTLSMDPRDSRRRYVYSLTISLVVIAQEQPSPWLGHLLDLGLSCSESAIRGHSGWRWIKASSQMLTQYLGKSVLASLIVEESQALAAPKNLKVIYFYCRHGDLERNSFVAMARCFLRDLLNADDQVTAHIYEAAVDSKEPYLRTQNHSRDLLNICLKAVGRTYIILDGLDECEEAEQKHIAEWLRKYVEDSASGQDSSKCVFISQDCHSTRSSLGKLPSIRITSAENRTDIESYCAWWSQRIKAAFHPHEVDEKILATRTSAKADGEPTYGRTWSRT